jgi:hypothetical protein
MEEDKGEEKDEEMRARGRQGRRESAGGGAFLLGLWLVLSM